MKFTLINLMLVGATMALPADVSRQNYKRDNQDAQEATVKEDWPFGPGPRNGVAFRDLTGTEPTVKRDN
ncbi:hypothetical protein AbraIFM66950_005005 [Aspergillus brasiliensis]|nr:hypothetical protein AbraIFM66950_005005 [Aspergillus brasiliensis]